MSLLVCWARRTRLPDLQQVIHTVGYPHKEPSRSLKSLGFDFRVHFLALGFRGLGFKGFGGLLFWF